MSRLTPLDLAFLALENSSRMTHMAAYQVFQIPSGQKKTFIPRLLEAYRGSDIGKPFNQKLKWLDKGVASWETVEPDPRYHIRHIAVPPPGRMEDFYEIVSFLNTNLLDRNCPLWECYIIEGLPGDKFAILIKVHHAMIDGGGALKLFESSLNTSARDKSIRAYWAPVEKPPKKKRPARSDKSQLQKLVSRMGKLPTGILGVGVQLADLGAQNLRLKPQKGSLTFDARRTVFNNIPQSSERRYANCELSLNRVKAIAKATGTTVNDTVMALIDHALHRYLEEHDEPARRSLVTMMAMSIRSEEHGATGNQVSAELVPLGEPDADITSRLQQVYDSTGHIKKSSAKIPNAVRQLYSLVIFGAGTLPEFSSAFDSIPNANLLISNMIGPQQQLYLGGAPLVAFHGLPIVPPGCGLNVTFASINKDICLGIGAAPEAMEDPYHVTRMIIEALDELEKAVLPIKKKRQSTPRKATAGKKTSPKKSAASRKRSSTARGKNK